VASNEYYINSCKVLKLKSCLIYLESEKLKNSEALKESKPPMKEEKEKEEKPKKVKLSSDENKKEAKSSTSKSECKIDEDCADRM
jgi:hypothetical protein